LKNGVRSYANLKMTFLTLPYFWAFMMLVVGLILAFRAGELFAIKFCEPNSSSCFFLRIQLIHDFPKSHMGVLHGAPSSTKSIARYFYKSQALFG
jgi:hypothetical protein